MDRRPGRWPRIATVPPSLMAVLALAGVLLAALPGRCDGDPEAAGRGGPAGAAAVGDAGGTAGGTAEAAAAADGATVRTAAGDAATSSAGGFLAPWQPGEALPGGWTWEDTRPGRPGLDLGIRSPDGTGRVTVQVRQSAPGVPRLCTASGLDFAYLGDPWTRAHERAVADLVTALCARAQANGPGPVTLPADEGPAPGAARDRPGERAAPAWQWPWHWLWALRALLVTLFVLLAAVTARELARAWAAAPPPAWASWGILASFAAALALRLLLSPQAFLHEFYHHAGYVQATLLQAAAPTQYGDTGPALYRVLAWLTGEAERAIFWSNAVLAALTVPATILLDFVLFRRWDRALLAGWILCCFPLHLRYSAAEDPVIPATLFTVWALALAVDWVDRRRAGSLAGAVAALALAMQCRTEMLALPGLVVAFVVLARGGAGLRALVSGRFVLAVLGLVLLVLPRVLQMLSAGDQSSPGGGSAVLTLDGLARALAPSDWSRAVTLLDPGVTPAVLAWMAAAGLAWAAFSRSGALAACALATAAFFVATRSMYDSREFLARTQVWCTPLWAILGASALPLASAVADALGRRAGAASGRVLRGAVVLAACGLPVAAVALGAGSVARPTDATQEWEFLRQAVPSLPSPVTILARTSVAPNLSDPFPTWLPARFGKQARVMDLQVLVDAPPGAPDGFPRAAPGLVFWQGMDCYVSLDEHEPRDPLREHCAAVHRRYVLRPLVLGRVTADPGSHAFYSPRTDGAWEIGFFEVVGDRLP